MVRLTDRPDMTLDVYCGRMDVKQQHNNNNNIMLIGTYRQTSLIIDKYGIYTNGTEFILFLAVLENLTCPGAKTAHIRH